MRTPKRASQPIHTPIPTTRIRTYDLDKSGVYGKLIDLLAKHCEDEGFAAGYDCTSLIIRNITDQPANIVLICIDERNHQVLGYALITRNHLLALPYKFWTLQGISSKQPGCGTQLMERFVDMAKKASVDYLGIFGYSDLGMRLYDKFGFKEIDPFGLFLNLQEPSQPVPFSVALIVHIGHQLYRYEVVVQITDIKQVTKEFYEDVAVTESMLKRKHQHLLPSWMYRDGDKIPSDAFARWTSFRKWAKSMIAL